MFINITKNQPQQNIGAECALSVDDEAWNYIASDQTADTLLDINGIDLLGYVLYYFSHPSYGHKEQSELVSTEILTLVIIHIIAVNMHIQMLFLAQIRHFGL